MKIIGASLGECVHIQGVYNFLRKAQEEGHETKLVGPAVSVDRLIEEIRREQPDSVAVSYRLTPETGRETVNALKNAVEEAGIKDHQSDR